MGNMKLTKAEIRQYVREWVADPKKDAFTDVRLDLYIDAAYDHISTIVAASRKPYYIDLESESFEITPVATEREYKIDVEKVRRVFEVTDESDTGRFDLVVMVPFTQRNQRSSGVYTFRASDGFWYLGLVYIPSHYTNLHVRVVKEPIALATDNAVPEAVPYEHHLLITFKAALLLKGHQNREMAGIAALYTEALIEMSDSLDRGDEQFTARRMSR